jgi:hypothetical protein
MMASVATTCEECEGKRFQASVLDYTLGGKDIAEVLAMSSREAAEFFGRGAGRVPAAHDPRTARDVGLGYLRLGQPLTTCPAGSGSGSSWRPTWAKGGVYVLDEPTTGLHLADVENLLGLLDRLVDSGKSVIVIEHHQAVMAHADWIIDLGPGAGHDGGGSSSREPRRHWSQAASTLTGQHLADVHVKTHEYGGMTAAAAQIRSAGCPVLLVGPFTAAIRSPQEWADWVNALGGEPVRLIWVGVEPGLLRDRIEQRGSAGDRGKLAEWERFVSRMQPAVPPPVPHVAIRNDGSPEDLQVQVQVLVAELGGE